MKPDIRATAFAEEALQVRPRRPQRDPRFCPAKACGRNHLRAVGRPLQACQTARGAGRRPAPRYRRAGRSVQPASARTCGSLACIARRGPAKTCVPMRSLDDRACWRTGTATRFSMRNQAGSGYLRRVAPGNPPTNTPRRRCAAPRDVLASPSEKDFPARRTPESWEARAAARTL